MFLARRSRLAYEDQPSEMAQDFMVGKRAKDAVIWKGVASLATENSQLKANALVEQYVPSIDMSVSTDPTSCVWKPSPSLYLLIQYEET